MAMWLAVVLSLPFMALLAEGERLMLWLGQDPAVAERGGLFLGVLLWALIPAVAAQGMRGAVAALGRPGWALGVTVLALGVSLLANYALVFGHFGASALGLAGSALASTLTAAATALAYAAILLLDPRLRRWRLFGRWWRLERRRLAEIVALGAPIALTYTFEAGLFTGAGFLMGLFGVAEVAGHAVALQTAALAFQLPFGVAQAATIRVGLFFGARDAAGAGRAGWVALVLGTGVMAATAALLLAVPGPFIRLYLDPSAPGSARAAALAGQYLVVAAAFQLFDGAQAVAAGILRGLQDTRVPMLIALGGYWIAGFGTAVWAGFGTSLGGLGVWIGLAVGLAAVAALLTWRWSARERLGLVPHAP
jgi:MATE family multidrug resistance protein